MLLALAALYDAAVANDPDNGAANFLASDQNQTASILSADGMHSYSVKLAAQDGTEPDQHGDENGMTTWRGQLEQVVVAAGENRDGATADLTSGDGQYVLHLTFSVPTPEDAQ